MTARKRPEDRHNRNKIAEVGLVVVKDPEDGTPAPDRAWLVATRDAWGAYWSSEVASLARPEDTVALRRLFGMYDQQLRASRMYDREPFVEGSKGQPVENPAGDRALKLEAHIRQLEDRFGITPLARLRLGVTFGQAQLTAAELNRRAKEVADDGEWTAG